MKIFLYVSIHNVILNFLFTSLRSQASKCAQASNCYLELMNNSKFQKPTFQDYKTLEVSSRKFQPKNIEF